MFWYKTTPRLVKKKPNDSIKATLSLWIFKIELSCAGVKKVIKIMTGAPK